MEEVSKESIDVPFLGFSLLYSVHVLSAESMLLREHDYVLYKALIYYY